MFEVQFTDVATPALAIGAARPSRERHLHGYHAVVELVDAASPAGAAWPVLRSLALIARHYASRLTLDDLADHAGQTPFQLIRAFRRDVGLTPHAALVRVRVLVATYLIETGIGLAQAAADAGFVDQTHFTRHFKRLHRTTPREYLNRMRLAAPASDRAATPSDPRRRLGVE